MSSQTPRLVVCGGNGFLGSRICKSAVSRGWSVTSISRSGPPDWQSSTGSPTPPPWSTSVTWARGNILSPSTYRQHLVGATVVIHSMGILLEADYKGVLSGKESPISGLKKAFDAGRATSRNPLREKGEEPQMTYETMNRDSAITLTEEALSANNTLQTVVYISAADGSLVLPSRYITTKREAEAGIAKLAEGEKRFRAVFFRPGFLYDSSRPITMPLAGVMGVTAGMQSLFGGRLPGLGAAGHKPLKVEVVAEAVVEAVSSGVEGVVDVGKIEELAKKAWRAAML